jgi:hypothetical protein
MHDVLHRVLALVLERHGAAVALRHLDGFRHRDAAGLGKRLQARRDVDAITVHSAVGLFDHIAQMHADPESHPAFFGEGFSRLREFLLHRERRAHGAARRFEHCEHRVTGHVDNAALVRFDQPAEDAARCVKRRDGRPFVRGHEARIADRVSGEDRREPLPHAGISHGSRFLGKVERIRNIDVVLGPLPRFLQERRRLPQCGIFVATRGDLVRARAPSQTGPASPRVGSTSRKSSA